MAKTKRHNLENKEYIEAMRELRNGSRTSPHRNLSKYNRKQKHKGKGFDNE